MNNSISVIKMLTADLFRAEVNARKKGVRPLLEVVFSPEGYERARAEAEPGTFDFRGPDWREVMGHPFRVIPAGMPELYQIREIDG